MITPFYRHGIMSNSNSMECLAKQLDKEECFSAANNECYRWRNEVVESGLSLADRVLGATATGSKVLLVGHSQGGLVCRVAAVALVGECIGKGGEVTRRIKQWQSRAETSRGRRLGVVTIATPNAGALTFGQMSVAAELLARTVMGAARLLLGFADAKDLTTPRLFQEFENWRVNARYLSISGVCVNRYNRGLIGNLAELCPTRRVSIRFDVPNDCVVEDSSTDLRQSLFRPDVDLGANYKHVRAFPTSTVLWHSDIRDSGEVAKLIADNLRWLVR